MPARILVVDDVEPNVRLLEAKLTAEFYDVITATDGAAALECARERAPDLVLLDVMMPGMNGFEVCRHIKADPAISHLPVVMVTALSDTADRVRGLEAGADDFLSKPVDDWALFARVRSLVRLKLTMDELRLRHATGESLGVLSADPPLLEMDAKHARVLIVTGNAREAERAESALAEDGDSAVIAKTTADAARAAEAEEFDVFCVSLIGAGDEPLRLISHLRSAVATRHTPLLVMAEERDRARVGTCLEMGATDFIFSPYDRHELLARVRNQVRRRRYHQRLRDDYLAGLTVALRDPLTGLYNRRYLESHLLAKFEGGAATARRLTALMIDIDRFKAINDTYGHAAGDTVLKAVAERISSGLRNFDTVARYGGEEFVAIIPDDVNGSSLNAAERLRRAVADSPISCGDASIFVTISIGAATQRPDDTPESLIHRADEALYSAKRAGRNRVHSDGEVAAPAAAPADYAQAS